jgi:hypothetical protein
MHFILCFFIVKLVSNYAGIPTTFYRRARLFNCIYCCINCISCVLNVRIIRAVIDDGHVYGEQALTVTKRRAPAEAI